MPARTPYTPPNWRRAVSRKIVAKRSTRRRRLLPATAANRRAPHGRDWKIALCAHSKKHQATFFRRLFVLRLFAFRQRVQQRHDQRLLHLTNPEAERAAAALVGYFAASINHVEP